MPSLVRRAAKRGKKRKPDVFLSFNPGHPPEKGKEVTEEKKVPSCNPGDLRKGKSQQKKKEDDPAARRRGGGKNRSLYTFTTSEKREREEEEEGGGGETALFDEQLLGQKRGKKEDRAPPTSLIN